MVDRQDQQQARLGDVEHRHGGRDYHQRGARDRFGVPPRIASFVLPLGYSFNLDGSMMYMTFASASPPRGC
jgi:hypothetical protein